MENGFYVFQVSINLVENRVSFSKRQLKNFLNKPYRIDINQNNIPANTKTTVKILILFNNDLPNIKPKRNMIIHNDKNDNNKGKLYVLPYLFNPKINAIIPTQRTNENIKALPI